MRPLVDTETGELVEILDEQSMVADAQPYSYETFRRAAMTVSREHKAAIARTEETARGVAAADGEYHKQLAIAVGRLRSTNSAATAERLAKGDEKVVAAKVKMDEAAAEDRAAMERVRLARDDRAALLTMGAWSRAHEDWEG